MFLIKYHQLHTSCKISNVHKTVDKCLSQMIDDKFMKDFSGNYKNLLNYHTISTQFINEFIKIIASIFKYL